jgi:hypothetical protein
MVIHITILRSPMARFFSREVMIGIATVAINIDIKSSFATRRGV